MLQKLIKSINLELRKKELIAYAKDAIHEIQEEISENERKIRIVKVVLSMPPKIKTWNQKFKK